MFYHVPVYPPANPRPTARVRYMVALGKSPLTFFFFCFVDFFLQYSTVYEYIHKYIQILPDRRYRVFFFFFPTVLYTLFLTQEWFRYVRVLLLDFLQYSTVYEYIHRYKFYPIEGFLFFFPPIIVYSIFYAFSYYRSNVVTFCLGFWYLSWCGVYRQAVSTPELGTGCLGRVYNFYQVPYI